MQYIVTADEMREYDNNTITKIGIPSLVLMERAALAVRDVIIKAHATRGKVLIVCGSGNNGADGLALARMLWEEGYEVVVCLVGNQTHASEQYKQQMAMLKHYPVTVWEADMAAECLEKVATENVNCFDIVVDSVFGVGLSREITGVYAKAIEWMNELRGCKVAVDICSGICADTGKVLGVAFRADDTVTFGFAKRGLYLYPGADYSGQIHVADIGISLRSFFGREPEVFAYNENVLTLLPKRAKDGNKGTFGKVLLIAGFEHMVGAAILCARGVLETGAGMVKVLCPLENRAILQGAVPEVLYGTCEELKSSIEWADVIAVGPGLGKTKEAEDILKQLLEKAELPMVLDADALNLVSESQILQASLKQYPAPKIMTPHVGELARLSKQHIFYLKEHLPEVAKRMAKEYHSIMVCKDARTFVAGEAGPIYLNLSGNNGMATAGSGDVLTGIVAAMLAQGLDIFEAAAVGVYLHGLAGDAASEKHTEYGVTASRIVEGIRDLYRE